ncbi:MAG: hypothetical protein K2L94_04385, partial [Alphaproteobacteria bacterium]|nr:hypothetical protein [Alphaproteobacteria bacterium]
MKKTILFLTGILSCAPMMGAHAAVAVKKAAPVATQESAGTAGAASLIPTVLNLVSGVQALNAQQKALTAECIPTTAEINFVNTTMQEWAKTGAATAADVQRSLRRKRCQSATGGYQAAVRIAAATDGADICFDWFGDNPEMVWYQFPKASKATYCPDGSIDTTCSDMKTVSDIYEIFNLIDFSAEDYTATEATMAAKLLNKIESCSSAKLSAKKKAMWGEFLIDTVGNLGQSTNTGAIMQ